jgi:hypothetical protein
MTISLTHAKVSTKTDVTDTDLVRPSDWNAEHVFTGTLDVANGGTGTSTTMTLGSVLFSGASGVYSQDNANFFLDNTNNRLGIGTTSPRQTLEVNGIIQAYNGDTLTDPGTALGNGARFSLNSSSSNPFAIGIGAIDGSQYPMWFQTGSNGGGFEWYIHTTEKMRIDKTGNLGVGTATPVNKLDVEGAVAIGATYSGTSTAPTNGCIIEGQLGVGTASPTASFSIHAAAGVFAGPATTHDSFINVFFQNNDNGKFGSYNGHQYFVNGWGSGQGWIWYAETSATEEVWRRKFGHRHDHPGKPTNGMIVEGNVGIGTASPASACNAVVASGSAASIGCFERTSNMYFSIHGNNAWATLVSDKSIRLFAGVSSRSGVDGVGIYIDNGDYIAKGNTGIGTTTPATLLELEKDATLTGNVTDSYTGAITLDPGYTVTNGGSYTVTRHNYIDVNNPSETETSGTITITDAAIMRFDAAAGTHKAVDGSSTKITVTAVDGWLKYNINGTIYYSPLYTSKTA